MHGLPDKYIAIIENGLLSITLEAVRGKICGRLYRMGEEKRQRILLARDQGETINDKCTFRL